MRQVEKKKKRKKKTKVKNKSSMKRWEKTFIFLSLTIMFIILGIYTSRASYYYKKLNYIEPDSKLLDVLTNDNNIVYTGDGLYKIDDKNYYYSGTNPNNYLLYSGRIWRIISIDEAGIKIITNDNETMLVWGNETNYENSLINKWLNEDKYINTLDNQEYIVNSNWCNNSIDINDYECTEVYQTKIGLLDIKEYLKAGGVNSYLNTKTYFWTINTSQNNKAYYIHNQGGINDDIGNNNSLYSYGVRPVIYLSPDINYLSGTGKIDNPYTITNNEDIKISNHSIGDYVNYSGYNFQIIEKNEEYTKLILDGYILDEESNPIKLSYDKVDNYLNKDFIQKLDKSSLVEISYQQIEFNSKNNYNYNNTKNNIKRYIGLPNVGDLFITKYPNTWLNTYKENNLVYKVTEDSIMADLKNSENYLRPIIAIKNDLIISSGKGTKDEPYLLEVTE